MRKDLSDVTFKELRGKTFEVIRVVEQLCEVCQKPLSAKEKFIKETEFIKDEDYLNLLNRAKVHDRAEVDVENCRIYFYDHDFPGDMHTECIEKL